MPKNPLKTQHDKAQKPFKSDSATSAKTQKPKKKETKIANKTTRQAGKDTKNNRKLSVPKADISRKLSTKREAEVAERRRIVWDLFMKKRTVRQISEDLKNAILIVFKPEEFVSPRSLFIKLKERKDDVSKYIFARLSKKLVSDIVNYQNLVPLHIDYIKLLAADFNDIIKTQILSEEKAFQKLTLSDETKNLIETAGDADFYRLNRMLIEDAYPLEIQKQLPIRGLSPSQVQADIIYSLGLKDEDLKFEVEHYIESEIAQLDAVNAKANQLLPKATKAREVKDLGETVINCVNARAKLRDLYKPKKIIIEDDRQFAEQLGISLEDLPNDDKS